jgi:hypothetical protein
MAMKNTALALLILLLLNACSNGNSIPDVSNININLKVERFDENFFSIDTMQLGNGLARLAQNFPDFTGPFLNTIVAATDSAGVKTFYRLYHPIFDSSQKIYRDFSPVKSEMEEALRYVKFYFPEYKAPSKLLTIVGPMNSIEDMAKMENGEFTPDFIGQDFIGVSLQFYLGKNSSYYQNEYFVNRVAPLYRSRRFDRDYIVPDAMKLVVDDLFPDKSKTKSLVEQMIERGKQWWLLDKFLPRTADSLKTGFTTHQLDWCRENEGLIWSYILKNEDLYTLEPTTIQLYIGEAPFTQGFSQEDSPGNLGTWLGRQIVKKFVANNAAVTPAALMKMPARQILEQAKYKPK